MPKLPRDCGARQLTALLQQYGYVVVRQHGSHVVTLSAILSDLADVLMVEKEELIRRL